MTDDPHNLALRVHRRLSATIGPLADAASGLLAAVRGVASHVAGPAPVGAPAVVKVRVERRLDRQEPRP